MVFRSKILTLSVALFSLYSSEVSQKKRKNNQEEGISNKQLRRQIIKIRNNSELFTVPDMVVQESTTLCDMLCSTEVGNIGATSSSTASSLVELSNKFELLRLENQRETIVLDLENESIEKDIIDQIEKILISKDATHIQDKNRLIKIVQCANYLNINLRGRLKFDYRDFNNDETPQLNTYCKDELDYLLSLIERKKNCIKIWGKIYSYHNNEINSHSPAQCIFDKIDGPYYSPQCVLKLASPQVHDTQTYQNGSNFLGRYSHPHQNIFSELTGNKIIPFSKNHVMFKSNGTGEIVTLNVATGLTVFHRINRNSLHDFHRVWHVYKLYEDSDHVKILIFNASSPDNGSVHILEATFKLEEKHEPQIVTLKPFLPLGECDLSNTTDGTGTMGYKKKPVKYFEKLTVQKYNKIVLLAKNKLIIIDENENIKTIDLNRYIPDFPEAESLNQIDKNTYLINYNKDRYKILKVTLNNDTTVNSIRTIFDYKDLVQPQNSLVTTNVYQIDGNNFLIQLTEFIFSKNTNTVKYYVYNSINDSVDPIPDPVNDNNIRSFINLGFNRILVFGKKIQELEYKIKNNKLPFYKNRTRAINNPKKLIFPQIRTEYTNQNLVYAFKTTKKTPNPELKLVTIPLAPNFNL